MNKWPINNLHPKKGTLIMRGSRCIRPLILDEFDCRSKSIDKLLGLWSYDQLDHSISSQVVSSELLLVIANREIIFLSTGFEETFRPFDLLKHLKSRKFLTHLHVIIIGTFGPRKVQLLTTNYSSKLWSSLIHLQSTWSIFLGKLRNLWLWASCEVASETKCLTRLVHHAFCTAAKEHVSKWVALRSIGLNGLLQQLACESHVWNSVFRTLVTYKL